jgi:hypothetical protein
MTQRTQIKQLKQLEKFVSICVLFGDKNPILI